MFPYLVFRRSPTRSHETPPPEILLQPVSGQQTPISVRARSVHCSGFAKPWGWGRRASVVSLLLSAVRSADVNYNSCLAYRSVQYRPAEKATIQIECEPHFLPKSMRNPIVQMWPDTNSYINVTSNNGCDSRQSKVLSLTRNNRFGHIELYVYILLNVRYHHFFSFFSFFSLSLQY